MAPVVVRVACLLAVAAGMINDVHIEFGKVDVFEIVWSFEFGEGGKMDLSGQTWIPSPAPNATVQMMVCSATSLVQVRSMRIEDVCAPPVFNAAACVWQDVMAYERNPIQMSITTPTKDWYYLLQLNCAGQPFTLDAHIMASNTGPLYSGFLSLSEAPFIPLSIASAVVWTALAMAQFLAWFPYRHFNVQVQARINAVMALFIVFNSLQIYYWNYCSVYGVKPAWAQWSAFAALLVLKASLFALLVAVSRGWSIVKKTLSKDDQRQVGTLTVGVLIAVSCYTILGGMGLFTMILIYALVLKTMFNGVVHIMISIDSQMQLVRSMSMEPQAFPLFVKRRLYHQFQLVFLSYIAMKVVFMLWNNIFLQDLPWVADLIDSFLDVVFVVSFCVLFRMRPFHPGFAFTPVPTEDVEHAMGAAAIWTPGMPLPLLSFEYATWLHPYSEALVLIDGPNRIVDIGREVVVDSPAATKTTR
ncbi:GOST seven transmembrane domain-containing protein [Plasmodiophora brassicae]